MFVPARALNIALARCIVFPTPAEPYAILLSGLRAIAISSWSECAGDDGRTTRISPSEADSCETGTKSLIASNGSFLRTLGLIANAADDINKVCPSAAALATISAPMRRRRAEQGCPFRGCDPGDGCCARDKFNGAHPDSRTFSSRKRGASQGGRGFPLGSDPGDAQGAGIDNDALPASFTVASRKRVPAPRSAGPCSLLAGARPRRRGCQ